MHVGAQLRRFGVTGEGDHALTVQSPYEPAGDQPQAIEKLSDGVRAGLRYQTLMGVTGIFGFIMVGVFGIAEIVALVKTGGQCFLHDVLADTYVIDWSSQPIFDTAEERDTFLAEREAARKAAEEENEAFY